MSTLDGSQAPDFVWITPNDCNNMHGDSNTGSPCKGVTGNPLIKAGDTWLCSNLAPVLARIGSRQNGTVIITWDEGTTKKGCCGLGVSAGGHIATLVILTNAGKGTFTTPGDHYDKLRGIEEAYGVSLLGGSANIVNGDLRERVLAGRRLLTFAGHVHAPARQTAGRRGCEAAAMTPPNLPRRSPLEVVAAPPSSFSPNASSMERRVP